VEVNRDGVTPNHLYIIIQYTTQQHLHYSSKMSSNGGNRNSQLDCQLMLMSQYHRLGELQISTGLITGPHQSITAKSDDTILSNFKTWFYPSV